MTREQINCPRARTWMTPCIARDGHLALADPPYCVGCGQDPYRLLADLAERYPPAGESRPVDAAAAADRLTECVGAYVEAKP